MAAKEQRVVATMDIGSAYLNADMKAVVYMRLDPDQTRMLAELEPCVLRAI
jgi:dihydroxyacetone kinase DhaKLM complex PTS-EIIA-like component DhaM